MSVSTEELAGLRDEVEDWFTDVLDTYRITQVDDPYGGEDVTEAIYLVDVPCMLESGAAHEQVRALMSKLQGVEIMLVSVPANTDVRVDDHFIVKTQGNLHLRVQAVLAPESYEIERRVVTSTLGEHHA